MLPHSVALLGGECSLVHVKMPIQQAESLVAKLDILQNVAEEVELDEFLADVETVKQEPHLAEGHVVCVHPIHIHREHVRCTKIW